MRPQVEILKAAQPDAVICIGAYAACAGFARDAVDLRLRVPIANLSFVGSENLPKLLAEGREDSREYTDLLVNSQVVPSYEDISIPAVREYRDFMERYDPEPPGELVREPYPPFPHSFVTLDLRDERGRRVPRPHLRPGHSGGDSRGRPVEHRDGGAQPARHGRLRRRRTPVATVAKWYPDHKGLAHRHRRDGLRGRRVSPEQGAGAGAGGPVTDGTRRRPVGGVPLLRPRVRLCSLPRQHGAAGSAGGLRGRRGGERGNRTGRAAACVPRLSRVRRHVDRVLLQYLRRHLRDQLPVAAPAGCVGARESDRGAGDPGQPTGRPSLPSARSAMGWGGCCGE